MPRFIRIYAIRGLLVALSLWLIVGIRSDTDSDAQSTPRGPALQLQAFSATYLDASGQQRYALQAPYLVQLPNDRGIEVQAPRLEIFTPDGKREWLIESEQGWLSADHQLVILRETVNAERHSDDPNEALSILTRDLSYYRKTQRLSSDAPTRLETPSGWLQGTGLRANLAEGRYTLLWDVRGEYAPPSS